MPTEVTTETVDKSPPPEQTITLTAGQALFQALSEAKPDAEAVKRDKIMECVNRACQYYGLKHQKHGEFDLSTEQRFTVLAYGEDLPRLLGIDRIEMVRCMNYVTNSGQKLFDALSSVNVESCANRNQIVHVCGSGQDPDTEFVEDKELYDSVMLDIGMQEQASLAGFDPNQPHSGMWPDPYEDQGPPDVAF